MRVLFSHVWFYLDLYSDIIFSLVEIGRGAELCFRTGALVGTAAPLELFFDGNGLQIYTGCCALQLNKLM
jgi:hypothetical protein